MKKVYNSIIQIWFVFISIATFLGINSILKFDYSGFISGICTISSIMLIEYLYTKKEKETIKETLNKIKIIHSLDYHNLKNIKNIEFTIDGDYMVTLNRNDKEITMKLKNEYVPKDQEMLTKLDDIYYGINIIK